MVLKPFLPSRILLWRYREEKGEELWEEVTTTFETRSPRGPVLGAGVESIGSTDPFVIPVPQATEQKRRIAVTILPLTAPKPKPAATKHTPARRCGMCVPKNWAAVPLSGVNASSRGRRSEGGVPVAAAGTLSLGKGERAQGVPEVTTELTGTASMGGVVPVALPNNRLCRLRRDTHQWPPRCSRLPHGSLGAFQRPSGRDWRRWLTLQPTGSPRPPVGETRRSPRRRENARKG